ncbi:hypothetical protein HJFPF1_07358 [Paramyrothecium foliicola]|nr:hypothetical protein HJFPF1_07358 [Paramyrothecium foliicola]
MNQFELSSAAQKLAAVAGERLRNEQPLPKATDRKRGVRAGQLGYTFDWLPVHERLWEQLIADHSLTGTAKARRRVVRLRAGRGLKTPAGTACLYVPVDGLISHAHVRTGRGYTGQRLEWRPDWGFWLGEGFTIRAGADDLQFVMIELALGLDKAAEGEQGQTNTELGEAAGSRGVEEETAGAVYRTDGPLVFAPHTDPTGIVTRDQDKRQFDVDNFVPHSPRINHTHSSRGAVTSDLVPPVPLTAFYEIDGSPALPLLAALQHPFGNPAVISLTSRSLLLLHLHDHPRVQSRTSHSSTQPTARLAASRPYGPRHFSLTSSSRDVEPILLPENSLLLASASA